MSRTLDRQPLYPIELSQKPTTVCITGATGYAGSRLTARLLASGHEVHAVCLPTELRDATATQHLRNLPGAVERLHFFPGNLLEAGSMDDALQGCSYLVHLAAVVDLCPNKKARELMIAVGLKGTQNVLDSVNRTPSVTRVVMVSSVAAIVGKYKERGSGYTYSEEDWAVKAHPDRLTYHYTKRESEKLAWDMAEKQNRWKLVVVNPGVLLGPLMAPQHARGSPRYVVELLQRDMPLKMDLTTPYADVDDVAAAIGLVLFTPDAEGRHIVVSKVTSSAEIHDILGAQFPGVKVPEKHLPRWLGYMLTSLAPRQLGLDLDNFKYCHKGQLQVDNSKMVKKLGLKYIDFKQSVEDTARTCVALGLANEKIVPAGKAQEPPVSIVCTDEI